MALVVAQSIGWLNARVLLNIWDRLVAAVGFQPLTLPSKALAEENIWLNVSTWSTSQSSRDWSNTFAL